MIWYEDPWGLIKTYDRFVPSSTDDITDQLNSAVLFALYLTIALVLIKKNIMYAYIAVLVGAFSFFVNEHLKRQASVREKLENQIGVRKQKGAYCTKPTPDNPFMNTPVGTTSRAPACKHSDPKVAMESKKHFDANLSRVFGDVYHKNASDRQFFTNPITTTPNNDEAFKEFVYKLPQTLKQRGQNY